MRYQIGEFSRITSLSVKTLRFYHECGLLEPSFIDRESGYRFYDESCLERAGLIGELKALDFSLTEIKEILEQCADDSDLTGHVRQKLAEVRQKMARYIETQRKLNDFLLRTRGSAEPGIGPAGLQIVRRNLPSPLVASIRFKGRYHEVSLVFKKLFRHCGQLCCGAPFSLYYDQEYREADAEIEACVPVRARVEADGIRCARLQGGAAVALIHQGPYSSLGPAYKALIDHIHENRLTVHGPSREVYLKGPGIILPGNPKRFATEIQMLLSEERAYSSNR